MNKNENGVFVVADVLNREQRAIALVGRTKVMTSFEYHVYTKASAQINIL